MTKQEFQYAFQLFKARVFFVNYYTLGSNFHPYMSTSAAEFARNKLDYTTCGQCQDTVLSGFKTAHDFYREWDSKHCKDLSKKEYTDIVNDIEKLKDRYNYIEKISPIRDILFSEVVELSKMELKKK